MSVVAQGRRIRGNPPPITRQGFTLVKSAIQTVNNLATPADDNHFQFTLPGGSQTWFFEQRLIVVGASTAADIKCSFSVNNSATYEFSRLAAGSVQLSASPVAVSTGNVTSGTDAVRFILAHVGYIYTSTNDALVKFQWSQFSATVENLSIDKGSWMDLRRVL